MKNRNILFLFLSVLLLASAPLSAVTVYKVTDANGRVTYQNHPPFKGERVQTIEGIGRVETMEIDPEQNVVPARTNRSSPAPGARPDAADSPAEGAEDTDAMISPDELARRNNAAGVAIGMEDAARQGIDPQGVSGAGIEALGAPPPAAAGAGVSPGSPISPANPITPLR